LVDDADHLLTAVTLSEVLRSEGLLAFVKAFYGTVSHGCHPPLMPALTALFFPLFGTDLAAALWFHTLCGALLYGYLFALVKHLSTPLQGLIAAGVLALFPMTYGLARLYLLEFPLATGVVMWLYYFSRSDGLVKKGYVLPLGSLLGLGLLCKVSFLLYVAGPALWALARQAWGRPRPDLFRGTGPGRPPGLGLPQLVAARLAAVGCLGALPALPWYWRHATLPWKSIVLHVSGNSGELAIRPEAVSWAAFAWFVNALVKEGVSAYFIALGLALLGLLVLRRQSLGAGVGLLLAWLLPPFAVCAMMLLNTPRFVFPAYPAIAVLLSNALMKSLPGSPHVRTALLGGLFLVPLGNYLQLSFHDAWAWLPGPARSTDAFGVLDRSQGYEFTHRPSEERWPLATILQVLQENTQARAPAPASASVRSSWWAPWRRRPRPPAAPKKVTVFVCCSSFYLCPSNFSLLPEARATPLEIHFSLVSTEGELAEQMRRAGSCEFLVLQSPPAGPSQLGERVTLGPNVFRRVASVPLPASTASHVVVYQQW
jgi:hypothetical protein